MVEVTVRFAGTLLEVVTTDRYVVGDAPDADTPIAGVAPVVITEPRELMLGDVWITAVTATPAKPVPRQPIEVRPYAYLAASLACHVAVWIAAHSEGHIDDLKPGAQKQHLVANHMSTPLATKAEVDAPKLPTDDPDVADQEQQAVDPSVPTHKMQLGDDPIVEVPDDTDNPARPDHEEQKLAESRDTEPCSGRDCGIVKTGAYQTAVSAHGAGADFELAPRRPIDVSVVGCRVGEGCKTAQGNDQADLRAAVEGHLEQVMACFARGGSKAVIDFQIDPTGRFGRDKLPAHAPDASDCIAEILATVSFPRPTDGEPRKVTLAFARD